ncbi:hypothetical protein DFP72DRAFT_859238 [Ephemerocybe angulata]|uniref:Uncharacterized protein n=1 Tax=Ephemerocybe angulata TaxID=980116 RepID=A0A8H6HB56_9AGAR|nr:hypothetical protein DFP72DRAFT_859238 [Tulosesus angulatus]
MTGRALPEMAPAAAPALPADRSATAGACSSTRRSVAQTTKCGQPPGRRPALLNRRSRPPQPPARLDPPAIPAIPAAPSMPPRPSPTCHLNRYWCAPPQKACPAPSLQPT